jgi:hypothetical protein
MRRIGTQMRPLVLLLASCVAVPLVPVRAAAASDGDGLPSQPVTFGGGRVVIGGDAAASIAPEDTGFFNYSDYEHSTLREFRAGLSASIRAGDRVSILGELRTENFDRIRPFALYVRIRPWRGRRFDIQAGRIPPTFGSFTRQAYGHDNPLIGYPLAYQYLTSLRTDAVPADADELLRMRGRGWESSFGVGNLAPDRGLPLVTAFSWDTGVQVSAGWRALGVTAAVTNGSASNPRVDDDNEGKQVAARATLEPVTGLVLGGSFARGQFGAGVLVDAFEAAPPDRQFIQTAFGADVEYSRDHWVARADAVLSEWRIPAIRPPFVDGPLRALAVSVQGRYRFHPAVYAAVRAEHLAFSRVAGSTRYAAWDAPVTRVETGVGYYIRRNVIARATIQVNRREGGRVRDLALPAVQLLYWF